MDARIIGPANMNLFIWRDTKTWYFCRRGKYHIPPVFLFKLATLRDWSDVVVIAIHFGIVCLSDSYLFLIVLIAVLCNFQFIVVVLGVYSGVNSYYSDKVFVFGFKTDIFDSERSCMYSGPCTKKWTSRLR